MDRPKISGYSLFTLLFFVAGVMYYTSTKNTESNRVALPQLSRYGTAYYWAKVEEQKQVYVYGTTMGKIPWNIKYIDANKTSYQGDLEVLFKDFNNVLSTYIPTSQLSLFNQQDSIEHPHVWLTEVLDISKEVYENSDGAFDPTVLPLVNAWGFGPVKSEEKPNKAKLDSLLQYVGFDKITFDTSVVQKAQGVQLDFSAIAKGYAVDKAGELLESKGITNYMVEIGGEVRCRGMNMRGVAWTVGIRKPEREIKVADIFAMMDRSLATSGNYENYRYLEGKKYAHTIDPKTGNSVASNLLSASICSESCIVADAYATACMVLGVDKAKELITSTDGLEGGLIYHEGGKDVIWYSEGMIKMKLENGK